MAAALAFGSAAAVSHRSAAWLWGLIASHGSVDELTWPGHSSRRSGLFAHRSRLRDDEIDEVDGIQVTSVCRTLLDIAAMVPRRQLERAMTEAEIRELRDPVGLPALLRRHPRRRGNRIIRSLLEEKASGVPRSRLEERFASFLEREGVPRPELNAPVAVQGSFLTVDCLWREQRVVVELDGRRFHDTALAFEEDRRRDRALAAAGWQAIRVTWLQLQREPETVLGDLRSALGRS